MAARWSSLPGSRVRIEIPYTARAPFAAFHMRKQRWAALVCHRRAGKTVACIMDLVDHALRASKQDPRFAYAAPYYAQAKDVAWSYLKRFGAIVPGAQINESELRVDFGHNNARIRLYGLDNYDRMRGTYLDGIVLDEYGDADPRAWTEVIRPALADRAGWGVFIGTPKGSNHFYDVWKGAQGNDEWFSLMLKASESGLILPDELADARKGMTEDAYAQEFECSFQAAVAGAYYGREMNAALDEKRIDRIPHEPGVAVTTAWDLGMGDSTAIWCAQVVGREIRIIDYIENNGVGLDWYVNELRKRPYTWGDHILPHDAEVRELGTGKSRIETLRNLGLGSARVIPAQSIEDGINAARLLIPKCWFDAERCNHGIEALRNYRRRYDEQRKVFSDRPLHDWCSHGADAFRYLALGLPSSNSSGWGEPLKYDNRGYV